MPSIEPDLGTYLDRVGLTSLPPSAPARLGLVHRAHLYAVPFENLDIHLGRRLSLAPARLAEKLVHDRRGGFCYEQNLLFATMLGLLGIPVEMLSAQVVSGEGKVGPPFDHMTLRVSLPEGPVLADVGFGESFHHPLPFDGAWHRQPTGKEYRMAPEGDGHRVEHRDIDGETVSRDYLVDPTPRQPEEYEAMCLHHQTSSESSFTRAWLCSLALPDGRLTVKPWTIVETRSGRRTERPIGSAAELAALLAARFGMRGIEIPDAWFPG